MYQPRHFSESDATRIRDLITASPLATLIVVEDDRPVVNHIPFILAGALQEGASLQAHIPRANPLSKILQTPRQSIAVFHGPEGYISPSWYATKPKHGKVVPTWNYAVVHVHGIAGVVDDPDWVRRQMDALTNQQESPRSKPWDVADAPDDYISALPRSLVGVELSIERIEAKTKASQNQPEENQVSVLEWVGREQVGTKLAGFMRTVLNDLDA